MSLTEAQREDVAAAVVEVEAAIAALERAQEKLRQFNPLASSHTGNEAAAFMRVQRALVRIRPIPAAMNTV